MADLHDWLIRWASDNILEGHMASAATMDEAAADCLSAAEEEGLSTTALVATAGGDLVAWLREFKLEHLTGD